jgi:tetratricopeptide (TPR) repeat protein
MPNVSGSGVASGAVYFRQGRIPEAEQEWLSVISSGNRNARAYLGLARIGRALSLRRQSKALIDQARELNPLDPDIELSWNLTLPLSGRIRRLESYLESAKATADDRDESQRYLDYLKMHNQSQGTCHLINPPANAETRRPLAHRRRTPARLWAGGEPQRPQSHAHARYRRERHSRQSQSGTKSRLPARKGKNVCIMGGAGIIASFLDENEIDELIINVIPTLIGEGIPLIAPRHRTVPPKLI